MGKLLDAELPLSQVTVTPEPETDRDGSCHFLAPPPDLGGHLEPTVCSGWGIRMRKGLPHLPLP